MAQRREDSITKEHHASHRHSPLKYVRLTRQRASGGVEHPRPANRAATKLRPLLLAAIIVLGLTVVGLHVVGGLVLLKTGLRSLSLQGPLAYVVIGLMLVFAVLKLKHVVGVMHRKAKREGAGED